MNFALAILAPSVFIHLLLWFLGFVLLYRLRRLDDELHSPPPAVSVIIPARNEAERLPSLLASLQKQTLPPREVLVVDDHSTDDTAALAREWGAAVLHAAPLPEGWKGKTWACHQGARAATGDVLVFLDADTVLAPAGLARMVETRRRRGGVLSVQPHHEIQRPYENFSVVFNLVQLIASNAFTVFGDAVKRKRLFGPSLVVMRSDYERAGGHEAVRSAVVENFLLSEIFSGKGIPLLCYPGEGALSYRMYPNGFGELINGWTRSISAGARGTRPWVLLGIIGWMMGGLGTFRHLLMDLARRNVETLPWLIVLYLLFVFQTRRFFSKTGGFSVWASVFYPLPLGVFVIVFVRSTLLHFARRRVTWKGRPVSS